MQKFSKQGKLSAGVDTQHENITKNPNAIEMNLPENVPTENITAVILAGGRAQRMGGEDKGLLVLRGKPMIEYIIEAIRPQVGKLLINANRNLEIYQQYGYPVIADILGDYYGPLAGMASGIQAADTDYIVTVPCDSPLLPDNLVNTLYGSLRRHQAELSVAHDGQRMQPVFVLLKRDLLPSMLQYIESGGRKVDTWYALHQTALADFSAAPRAFMNINSPNDKQAVEKDFGEN